MVLSSYLLIKRPLIVCECCIVKLRWAIGIFDFFFTKDQNRLENHMHSQNSRANLFCVWYVFKDLSHTPLIFLPVHNQTWEYKQPRHLVVRDGSIITTTRQFPDMQVGMGQRLGPESNKDPFRVNFYHSCLFTLVLGTVSGFIPFIFSL